MSRVRLTRALVLEERQTAADGAGGFSVSWVPLGTLWADVAARGGYEDFIGAQARPRVRWRIIVRAAPVGAPSRPRADQRFREGARVFDILSVAEHDPLGRFLKIWAEEGVVV